MSIIQVICTLICVAAIAVGQLLFKRAGIEIESKGGWLHWSSLSYVLIALVVYGAATMLWIALLRTVPLSRAYVFMAFSFVIVPLASHWLFEEQLSGGMLLGSAMITGGILIATILR